MQWQKLRVSGHKVSANMTFQSDNSKFHSILKGLRGEYILYRITKNATF